MTRFADFHPAVLAVYFASVTLITMFSMHPILLITALAGAILFLFKSDKALNPRRDFGFYIILFLLISLSNPLFSHNGVTPLFFLNGNPVTLEAVFYGLDIAVMLTAVMLWFKNLSIVLTSDKLLFLLGKLSPKISLLVSSALRFIPLFKNQAAKIRQVQRAMGLFASDTWVDKIRGTVRVYSALITWAFENAVDTASSMTSRGYGLKGRSSFSLFKFRSSDITLLISVLIPDAVIITAMSLGRLDFSFYPAINASPLDFCGVLALICFMWIAFLPFIIEAKEGLQWRYYRSKI